MIATTIREMLTRDPFEPFRILTSSGESFVITDPQTVALMGSQVFIAHPKSDRSTFLPYLHVSGVDTLENGNGRAHRGKRRR